MSRPVIGITTYYVKAYEFGDIKARGQRDQDMLMSTMDYSLAVEKAGGIPVTLPCCSDKECIKGMAEKIDGLILAGGTDVDPFYYTDFVAKGVDCISIERDRFEMSILEEMYNLDKPVLGICRGLQLLNVYFKGTLNQHDFVNRISTISHSGRKLPKYEPRHSLRIKEGSKIMDIYDENEMLVNSYHHQVIDKLGEGLIATAFAPDDCIEGIEHVDKEFIVGVQWHPEMMAMVYEEQLKIFEELVSVSKNNNLLLTI